MKSSGTTLQAGVGTFFGVALTPGTVNQPAIVQISGVINPGATVVVGTPYVVSANVGGIAPWTDLVNPNYVAFLGYGISASQIDMAIKFSNGIVHP
jgi:hypothetical protein